MPQHTISRRQWTNEEETLLKDLLATKKYSFNQMAAYFPGRNGNSLRKHALTHLGLRNEGFVATKYTYDRTFFATPNPINCYIAGFYAADGHIADNPSTRILQISLAPQDSHQLETFKRLMGYNGKIRLDYREPTDGRAPFTMHTLTFYGARELTADLERVFGLTTNKTYRIPAPSLTDPRLQLCYLAGLLDGDGCVHISLHDYLSVSYTSCSLQIVEWIKVFSDSLNLKSLKRGRSGEITQEGSAYRYNIGGCKAVDLVLRIQALKSEGVPILDRKWDNPQLNTYIGAFQAKHNLLSPSPPTSSTTPPLNPSPI